MELTKNSGSVKTRFFILSDTHGIKFGKEERCLHRADVAIHCGDLTEESKLEEYRTTLRLLMDIQAPLKLVIAGNHDFTMDIPVFREKVAQAWPPLDSALVTKAYGHEGEARQLFEDARSAGIIFLDEGNHQFTLENGAKLTVYASPYTPSFGDWGFQFPSSQGHVFNMSKGVDLAMTHGHRLQTEGWMSGSFWSDYSSSTTTALLWPYPRRLGCKNGHLARTADGETVTFHRYRQRKVDDHREIVRLSTF